MMKSGEGLMRSRLNSNFSDNDLAEALKIANYADIVRQLDHYYGQGKINRNICIKSKNKIF